MTMIEAELGFLQVQRGLVLADTVKLRQAMLGKAPKRLDAVDMVGATHELVVAMIDAKVLCKADVHQSVIATPAIGVNDAVGIDFAADDGLQRGLGGIGDDFGVDAVIALEQTKDNGLAASTSATFASNASGAKVGLIGLEFTGKGRAGSAVLSQAQADALVDVIGAAHRQAAQPGRIAGGQVKGKQAQQLTELGFADFCATVVPVFPNHFKKLACARHMFAS